MSAKNSKNWPLPFAEPEEVGLSSERLARIRPAMQKFIDAGMDPNFNTMVIRKGKVVYHEVQGYMDFESKKPATKDTLYRLWSNTKPMTGVATMMCQEEGLLTLDDPISKYIPAFKNPVVRVADPPRTETGGMRVPMGVTITEPANREVTIRDCLRNTTGFATAANAPIQYLTEFADVFPEGKWFVTPARTISIAEAVERQARLPLNSHPGTRFEYQVGYPVIGRIIEIVTGKTLGDFYKEHIFKPLGMKDATFYLSNDQVARFPAVYRVLRSGDKWSLAVAETAETSEKVTGPPNYFEAGGGGGGVLATISDYARFAQMLLNGGDLDGARILSRTSVEVMSSSHTTDDIYISPRGPGFGFGMGVGVYNGRIPPLPRSVGTFGWSGMAGTTCSIDPKEELIWMCFTQVLAHSTMPGNTCHEDMERLVYAALTD